MPSATTEQRRGQEEGREEPVAERCSRWVASRSGRQCLRLRDVRAERSVGRVSHRASVEETDREAQRRTRPGSWSIAVVALPRAVRVGGIGAGGKANQTAQVATEQIVKRQRRRFAISL